MKMEQKNVNAKNWLGLILFVVLFVLMFVFKFDQRLIKPKKDKEKQKI